MAKKLFEISIRIIIDDKNEDIMEQLVELNNDILAGSAQRELLEHEGILDVKATLKEIRK
jgi:hypothetical protein